MTTSNDRVLIVGAGPVGLCLALKLTQAGIKSTIVEQLSDANFLDQVPRAGTNHVATLEMYDDIGLYEKLEPRGLIAPLFHYWDRAKGERIAEFDHAVLKNDTKFPFALQCERMKICEEALKLAKNNPLIDVRMATVFAGFQQDGDGVTALVENAAGENEPITGRYIVSCEGARSIIRKDIDVEFEGFTYPDRTLTLEIAYDFSRHGYTHRNYISDPVEWSNLFHWIGPPERWRIHFPTQPEDDEALLTRPEAMQARLTGFLDIGRPFDIVGYNFYTVHQRVAKAFRKGRAILAGDAAHVNSPIGGMGLNSGVHDAFNLADKFTRIWRGEDADALLDLYERQRRHIAVHSTQAQTIRNKKLLAERDPAVRKKNHDELRRQSEDPKLAREFLLRTSLIQSVRDAAAIT
jgi:3-(3-hydroxy-phenyl)propionate hydroxylase